MYFKKYKMFISYFVSNNALPTYSAALNLKVKLVFETMDNGHPNRAFFQKFETFGLGQTNWAEIL